MTTNESINRNYRYLITKKLEALERKAKAAETFLEAAQQFAKAAEANRNAAELLMESANAALRTIDKAQTFVQPRKRKQGAKVNGYRLHPAC